MKLPTVTALRWLGLALLGLIIAAAVALGASRLASQQIGIASESVSAGDTLAPPVTPKTRRRHEKPEREAPAKKKPPPDEASPSTGEPTEAVEPQAPATTPVAPSSGEDGGGDGGGPDD